MGFCEARWVKSIDQGVRVKTTTNTKHGGQKGTLCEQHASSLTSGLDGPDSDGKNDETISSVGGPELGCSPRMAPK